ncbi:MAG: hypothetical protein Q7S57_03970 [bacterium]|nr:hypothetical protein [bacterium]
MITPEEFKKLIDFAYEAHELNINDHGWTTRQRGMVPFVVHPIWCALMLLNDLSLPKEQRELGFHVLLLHDVVEDTTLPLPQDLSEEVVRLVGEMTYKNFDEEKTLVPYKSTFIQFLKVIDKVATIYDNFGDDNIMKPERKKEWRQYTELLLKNTEADFGHTQSYKVAKLIVENCGW